MCLDFSTGERGEEGLEMVDLAAGRGDRVCLPLLPSRETKPLSLEEGDPTLLSTVSLLLQEGSVAPLLHSLGVPLSLAGETSLFSGERGGVPLVLALLLSLRGDTAPLLQDWRGFPPLSLDRVDSQSDGRGEH
jgi:hypothetical protein